MNKTISTAAYSQALLPVNCLFFYACSVIIHSTYSSYIPFLCIIGSHSDSKLGDLLAWKTLVSLDQTLSSANRIA